MNQFGHDHEFTKLVLDLKGKDPDDAFSSIPYEKVSPSHLSPIPPAQARQLTTKKQGFHFLYYLEKLLTKPVFDTFIPHYFKTWARRSLDSYDFRHTLVTFFASDSKATKALQSVDWDTWFFAPGMPPKPDFDTSMVDKCYALADRWESFTSPAAHAKARAFEPAPSDIADWTANQIVVFLERVQGFKTPLPPAKSALLGETYSLTGTRNVELSSRYFGVGLRAADESVYGPTAELLGRVGRMKFVRPLYRGLVKCDRALALETFERNRDFYHPICRAQVEKDLKEGA